MSPCRRAKRILWLRLRRAQHSARDQARRALGAARAARAHAPPRRRAMAAWRRRCAWSAKRSAQPGCGSSCLEAWSRVLLTAVAEWSYMQVANPRCTPAQQVAEYVPTPTRSSASPCLEPAQQPLSIAHGPLLRGTAAVSLWPAAPRRGALIVCDQERVRQHTTLPTITLPYPMARAAAAARAPIVCQQERVCQRAVADAVADHQHGHGRRARQPPRPRPRRVLERPRRLQQPACRQRPFDPTPGAPASQPGARRESKRKDTPGSYTQHVRFKVPY